MRYDEGMANLCSNFNCSLDSNGRFSIGTTSSSPFSGASLPSRAISSCKPKSTLSTSLSGYCKGALIFALQSKECSWSELGHSHGWQEQKSRKRASFYRNGEATVISLTSSSIATKTRVPIYEQNPNVETQ